jgi:hypothetical protein
MRSVGPGPVVCESNLTWFLDFLWDYRDKKGTKIVHTKLRTNTLGKRRRLCQDIS